MTNWPKRVWDNKKRQVRQGKKQVWDVNWELKLNWWNKREDADSNYFQVYDNAWKQPEEPLKIYDNSWKELTPPTPPVELGFGTGYIITHYITEWTKRIRIGLTDSEGYVSMDLYCSIENGSISSAQVQFNATDLGIVLSDFDWSWLTDDLGSVYNFFWNLWALTNDLSDTSVFEIYWTIINTGLIDSLNSTITWQMQSLIDFCGYQYLTRNNVSLNVDNYVYNYGGVIATRGLDGTIKLFNVNKDNEDPNANMYIELNPDDTTLSVKWIFDLSFYYQQDENLDWYNLWIEALDNQRSFEYEWNYYYVSNIWDWIMWRGIGIPETVQINQYIWNQYSYALFQNPVEQIDIMLRSNEQNNVPVLMRSIMDSNSCSYNDNLYEGVLWGWSDGTHGLEFQVQNWAIVIIEVFWNMPQSQVILQEFENLSDSDRNMLFNYTDMVNSNGTGTIYPDLFNSLNRFQSCGVSAWDGYNIDGIDYQGFVNEFNGFIQDCIINQTPMIYWTPNNA